MAQSAVRKSHNPKVVSSILSCRTFGHSNTTWGEKPEPPISSTKKAWQQLFRNAAFTYKVPITPLMLHNEDSDDGAVGSA